MASKRRRGSGWEFVVRRAKLLDKPLYQSFDDEAEGADGPVLLNVDMRAIGPFAVPVGGLPAGAAGKR